MDNICSPNSAYTAYTQENLAEASCMFIQNMYRQCIQYIVEAVSRFCHVHGTDMYNKASAGQDSDCANEDQLLLLKYLLATGVFSYACAWCTVSVNSKL